MPEDVSKSGPTRTTSVAEGQSRRRSERVVLRIPLQLSAKMPDGKRISIKAQTLVVNAHGGLLDVGVGMTVGQQVLLNNLRSGRVATSKVVRVEGSEEGHFSVAFEFDFPTPGF